MGLILASQSKSRQSMLKNSGVEYRAIPADLDEENIMATLESEGASSGQIALELAKAKAMFISKQHPNDYVIGSDQVLSMDEVLYSKANNKTEAIERLMLFQGKEHFLTSAVCVAKAGEILWHKADVAALKMKEMSHEAIEKYTETAGDDLTSCVGCYAIEGAGIRLFHDIRGDHFTIMGMPLLPLLTYLDGQELL